MPKPIDYNFSQFPFETEHNFQYFYLYGENMSAEYRMKLIEKFKHDNEYCKLCLVHELYNGDIERKIFFDKLIKGNHGVIDLFMKNFPFTEEERKIAFQKIKEHTDPYVHTWFLRCKNIREEEKLIIESIQPSDRTNHGCYMQLMYISDITPETREKAFQSMLDRGIIYYLEKIYTAPHVAIPIWIPTYEQRKIVWERLRELRAGSRVYNGVLVFTGTFKERKSHIKIGNWKKIYKFSNDLIPGGRINDGLPLKVRIKNSEIIEVSLRELTLQEILSNISKHI